jgi:hypothetical protein
MQILELSSPTGPTGAQKLGSFKILDFLPKIKYYELLFLIIF